MAAPAAGENAGRGERGSYRAGFFFATLSFGFAVSIGFVSAVVTARVYGVGVIGEYALVGAPVAAMWILSTVKEQQAMIKEITGLTPREPRVTQLFAAVFGFSVLLTGTVSILAALACWIIFPGPFGRPDLLAPALVAIAGYAVVTNTGWNIDSIFAAFVAGRQLFWVRLHEAMSYLIIATALGLAWRSVWAMTIATIAASFTALIHRVIAVRAFVRFQLDRDELREGLKVLPDLLRFGLKATPGQIAQGASGQGGVWALGAVAPVQVVGAFSRALVIPKSLQQASNRITEVLYPTLVGRNSQGDGHGFDRALIDSIRYEVIGMLLLAAAIGGAAHTVLGIFGPGFGQADLALILLCLSPALASIAITQTQALWAVDKPGRTSLIAMLRLAVTIGLLVVLTPWLGINGPAIALLIGYGAVIGLAGLSLRHHLARPLRQTWSRRERLVLVPAYGAGFVAAHLVDKALPSVYALPLCFLAGGLAYVAVLIVLGGLNERDRRRIEDGLAGLRRRRGRKDAVPLAASTETQA